MYFISVCSIFCQAHVVYVPFLSPPPPMTFRFLQVHFCQLCFPQVLYSHFPLCSTAYLSSLASSVQCWVVCLSYYKFCESQLFMSWVSLMFIFRLCSCHSFSCFSFSFSQFRFQVNFSLFHLVWFLFLLSA